MHPSLCGCCSTSHNYPHTHQAVSVHVFNTMHQLNGEAFAVTNSPHRANKVHMYADVIIEGCELTGNTCQYSTVQYSTATGITYRSRRHRMASWGPCRRISECLEPTW